MYTIILETYLAILHYLRNTLLLQSTLCTQGVLPLLCKLVGLSNPQPRKKVDRLLLLLYITAAVFLFAVIERPRPRPRDQDDTKTQERLEAKSSACFLLANTNTIYLYYLLYYIL